MYMITKVYYTVIAYSCKSYTSCLMHKVDI